MQVEAAPLKSVFRVLTGERVSLERERFPSRLERRWATTIFVAKFKLLLQR